MKIDAFGARSTLDTGFGRAAIYRLDSLEKAGVAPASPGSRSRSRCCSKPSSAAWTASSSRRRT